MLVCCCATLAVPTLLLCLHRFLQARNRCWLYQPQEGPDAGAGGLPALGGGACELLQLAGLTPTAADTSLWCAHMHRMTSLQYGFRMTVRACVASVVQCQLLTWVAAVQYGVCVVMMCCSSTSSTALS